MAVGLGLGENDLQVEYVLRDNHEECWKAVLDGEADAYGPNVDLGTASVEGAAAVQHLEPSCSLYESNDMYGVLPESNLFTFQDMPTHARGMIANGTTPTIFIGGPFDWWPDVEPHLWPAGTNVINAITTYPNSTERSEVALDGLRNGTFMAIRLALLPGIWTELDAAGRCQCASGFSDDAFACVDDEATPGPTPPPVASPTGEVEDDIPTSITASTNGDGSSDLSGGAIAGFVVLGIAFAIAAIAALFYFHRSKELTLELEATQKELEDVEKPVEQFGEMEPEVA